MQPSTPEKNASAKQKIKQNTTPIRIKNQTHRTIRTLLQRANKKPYGRKVKADDIIAKSLALLQPNHIEELQEATLSNADRLDREYKLYCSQNGFIKRDDFIGKILSETSLGAVCSTSENPKEHNFTE